MTVSPRVLLVAALLAAACASALPLFRAVAQPHDAASDLFAGFVPRFEIGHAVPKEGVFGVALRPARDVVLPLRLDGAARSGYAGYVTLENVPAGRYRIVHAGAARLQAVQDQAVVPTLESPVCTGCPGSYQVVELAAAGGPLTLQISGAESPLIRIAVIRLELTCD